MSAGPRRVGRRLAGLLRGTKRHPGRVHDGTGDESGAQRDASAPVDEPAVSRARELSAARRWSEAASAWTEVAQQAPPPPPAEVLHRLAQALRMVRDHDGAARVCERGRQEHPDHPGLLIEDARISLYHHRRAAEDRHHAWRRRLLGVESRLRALEQVGEAPPSADVVLAELASELARADAAERWEAIADSHPRRRTTASLRRAQALRQAGELEAARAALEQIARPDRASPEVIRELARLDSSLRRWSSIELGRQARLRYRTGEVDAAVDQLRTALHLRGGEHLVVLATPVLDAVGDLLSECAASPASAPTAPSDEARGAPGAADEKAVPRVIHVCGLLYSGSGAVFDHLRTHPEVDVPFGSRELGFLKRSHNLAALIDLASDDVEQRAAAQFTAEVADAVLASVLGLGQSGRALVELVDAASIPDLVAVTLRLLAGLAKAAAMPGPAAVSVRAAVRDFDDEIVRLAARRPGATVLLNNALLANQLERLALFSSAQAVAVVRDPRDQYVSQRLEYGFPLDLDEFVSTMRDRLEQLSTLRATDGLGDRIRCVAFEDYVTRAGTRSEILSWLGLSPTGWEGDPAVFDPARSRTNIGIHRDHPDPRDMARIQADLGKLYAGLVR